MDAAKRTVLIADDEPGIPRMLGRYIARATVADEATKDVAVEMVFNWDDAPNALSLSIHRNVVLLLSDIDMPGENGVALAEKIHGVIPVILMTGGVPEGLVDRLNALLASKKVLGLLQKPFSDYPGVVRVILGILQGDPEAQRSLDDMTAETKAALHLPE